MFDEDAAHLTDYETLSLGGGDAGFIYSKTTWYLHPPLGPLEYEESKEDEEAYKATMGDCILLAIDYDTIDPNPDWHIEKDIHLKLYQIHTTLGALADICKGLKALVKNKQALNQAIADYPAFKLQISSNPEPEQFRGYRLFLDYESLNNQQKIQVSFNASSKDIMQFYARLERIINSPSFIRYT